jgi:hypothetical protein
VTSDNPQGVPDFEVPPNPLLKLPAETPYRRTRQVRRARPRPEAIGELMPEVAAEVRRIELERRAAITEDLLRTHVEGDQ